MSDEDSTESEELTWITWFLNLEGNEYFCEIDRSFIEDHFNLYGIKQIIPDNYSQAMDVILDKTPFNEIESMEISQAAKELYGLIHARYIITTNGLEDMQVKYCQNTFGSCSRYHCNNQSLIPMGLFDDMFQGPVGLFCAHCRQYYRTDSNHSHIDGAFFGSTFANLFFMTYEELVPKISSDSYIPRVFGFKIHSSSNSLPKEIIESSDNKECKRKSNNSDDNSKISSNNDVENLNKDTNTTDENVISLEFINNIVSDNNISVKKQKK